MLPSASHSRAYFTFSHIGIFNEQTLRHCCTNISHDIEGYKSLIARPYESVNRAMPGSYYSDVERTIYLTYYIIMEDISKYDELFQQERKFISFEYFNDYVRHLDYDDLVYGNDALSSLVVKHPGNSPLRLQSSRCHMFALSCASKRFCGACRRDKGRAQSIPVLDHPAAHGDPRQVSLGQLDRYCVEF